MLATSNATPLGNNRQTVLSASEESTIRDQSSVNFITFFTISVVAVLHEVLFYVF